MFHCPNGCANGGAEAFRAEAATYGVAMLNAEGQETAFKPATHERTGRVLCSACYARAEWVDARQGEMFPVALTLEGV